MRNRRYNRVCMHVGIYSDTKVAQSKKKALCLNVCYKCAHSLFKTFAFMKLADDEYKIITKQPRTFNESFKFYEK